MTLTKKQEAVIKRIEAICEASPWVLRITDSKKVSGPVLIISARYTDENGQQKLYEYGRMYNEDLRACKNAIKYMLYQVLDEYGNSLGLAELIDNKVEYRGNIPLDRVIGPKMALLFTLRPRSHDKNRIELLAWRIEKFTREEAMYWLGKVSVPSIYGKRNGERSMEWAKSGLRIMLVGQQKDKEVVGEILDTLRK